MPLTSGSHGYSPATVDQYPLIANGIYSIRHASQQTGDEIKVLLYTVTTGQLRGQRIFKLADESSSTHQWRGFATLMRDGSVYVWNSRADLRGRYIHNSLTAAFAHFVAASSRGEQYSRARNSDSEVMLEARTCIVCNLGVMHSGRNWCSNHGGLNHSPTTVTGGTRLTGTEGTVTITGRRNLERAQTAFASLGAQGGASARSARRLSELIDVQPEMIDVPAAVAQTSTRQTPRATRNERAELSSRQMSDLTPGMVK